MEHTEHRGADVTDAEPRLAATLIVVRSDPLEVLLVRRNARGMFGSALVFPGGVLEPGDDDPAWAQTARSAEPLASDERARRIAAIRETWEETGVLVGSGSPRIAEGAGFDPASVDLDLDVLHPFAHWVTPVGAPRRWDTRFYLAVAPHDAVALPDGLEILDTEWLAPSTALTLGEAGERRLVFPTIANLHLLATCTTVADAIALANRRPPFRVLPEVIRTPEGRLARISAEAGYPVLEHFEPA